MSENILQELWVLSLAVVLKRQSFKVMTPPQPVLNVTPIQDE